MGKFVDLTGKVFGRLTVIKLDHREKRAGVFWLCRCSNDGNEAVVSTSALNSGGTVSCGCYKIESKRKFLIDLTGLVFGRLTVIERSSDYVSPKGKKRVRYLCSCSCGNQVLVLGSGLTTKNAKSCGCLAKDVTSKLFLKDLTNKKFGRLLVIKRMEDRLDPKGRHLTQWLCKCDCGTVFPVLGNSLNRGNTSSCGCLAESLIASELKAYFIEKFKATKEYKPFKNPDTNRPLPYDIYIPKYKMFIEVHGGQHYMFIRHFHKTEDEFKYQKKLDRMKRKYARKNGVYVEIDLRKIKTTQDAIAHIEKIIEEE